MRPDLIRGARGLLGWSITDLADAAELSVSTIKRMEALESQAVSERAVAMAQEALEAAGVTFLEDEGAGPGLRIRRR